MREALLMMVNSITETAIQCVAGATGTTVAQAKARFEAATKPVEMIIEAENATRAAELSTMSAEKLKEELKKGEGGAGCDGCPSMGPLVAECKKGCGDQVCAACADGKWLNKETGICRICDDSLTLVD